LEEAMSETTKALLERLMEVWDDLNFPNGDGGMQAFKLRRAEDLQVDGPILTFEIERHGAIVAGGSTYAAIHHWRVDMERREATYREQERGRQVYPPNSAWRRAEVEAKAAEVAALIRQGGKRPRLKDVIPDYDRLPKQTREGRAARWKLALDAAIRDGLPEEAG
jgi:hypothetical protein